MLNTHTTTFSAWNREKCLVPNSYAVGWKWSGPGFVLCHYHINLIIVSWKWVLQIRTVCDTPTPSPTHTHSQCPLNRRVNENAFAFQCTATKQDCQPTLQMPTLLLKRHHSLALYPNLLLTYFLPPTPGSFLFFCFLITNPVAPGGCAWVNRAVGACHVCSSGEKSSQR